MAFCSLTPTFHTLVTDQFQDMGTFHKLQAPTRVFQMLLNEKAWLLQGVY